MGNTWSVFLLIFSVNESWCLKNCGHCHSTMRFSFHNSPCGTVANWNLRSPYLISYLFFELAVDATVVGYYIYTYIYDVLICIIKMISPCVVKKSSISQSQRQDSAESLGKVEEGAEVWILLIITTWLGAASRPDWSRLEKIRASRPNGLVAEFPLMMIPKISRVVKITIWLWLTVRHGKSPCYS